MFLQNEQYALGDRSWDACTISRWTVSRRTRRYLKRAVGYTFWGRFYPTLVAFAAENADRQTRRLLIGGYDGAAVFRVRESPRRAHAREGEISIWPSYDNTAGNFRIPIHGWSNGKNGNPSVISVMDSFDSALVCVPVLMHQRAPHHSCMSACTARACMYHTHSGWHRDRFIRSRVSSCQVANRQRVFRNGLMGLSINYRKNVENKDNFISSILQFNVERPIVPIIYITQALCWIVLLLWNKQHSISVFNIRWVFDSRGNSKKLDVPSAR